MNERDKHLSQALDALTALQEAMQQNTFWHYDDLLNAARHHIEEAAEMPRPSRIRSFVQRVRREAAA